MCMEKKNYINSKLSDESKGGQNNKVLETLRNIYVYILGSF